MSSVYVPLVEVDPTPAKCPVIPIIIVFVVIISLLIYLYFPRSESQSPVRNIPIL